MGNQTYRQFRLKLIDARRKAGLTQAQLAAHLNHPQSFVSKYERGERRLDFIEFLRIAEVLTIDLCTFVEEFKGSSSEGDQ